LNHPAVTDKAQGSDTQENGDEGKWHKLGCRGKETGGVKSKSWRGEVEERGGKRQPLRRNNATNDWEKKRALTIQKRAACGRRWLSRRSLSGKIKRQNRRKKSRRSRKAKTEK